MVTNEVGQKLHDRATRGEQLSEEERSWLSEWYARLDQEEMAMLARTAGADTAPELQAQVEQAVARLVALSQRIQTLTSQNARLRLEVERLERQLTDKLTTRAS